MEESEAVTELDGRAGLQDRLWLPILRGPLRGRRWLPAAGGKLLRILLSTYETRQTECFQQLVRSGDVVFDVGAHAGWYTLLGSVLAGPSGQVVAFEPHPRNMFYLKRHIRLNRCENVSTTEAAVGDHNGTVSFQPRGSGTGHIAEHGEFDVRMIRLDDFIESNELLPDVLKMDVEGAELRALRGARKMLMEVGPVVVLSVHSDKLYDRCVGWLDECGYASEIIVEQDGHARELLSRPR